MNWFDRANIITITILSIVITCLILNEIEYRQQTPKLESIGTFLITKFNENEKSCPGKIMANGQTVYVGAVAISPDIRDSGLLMFGDWIQIDGYGKYQVACLTHKRHKRLIDIYTDDVKEAKTHGAKRKRVYLVR